MGALGASALDPVAKSRLREVEVACHIRDALAFVEHKSHRARFVRLGSSIDTIFASHLVSTEADQGQFAVGVDPSTVMDLDSGRREWSQLRTVRNIASNPSLDVDYRELLVEEVAPAVAIAPKLAANIPPRSSLDAYVNEERRLGPAPRIETEHGALPLFGAADLVRVFSSPSSVAGERLGVSGRVHATRGLSYIDGLILGISYQDGSRFEILRHIGTLENPISLTVFSTMADQTRWRQAAWTQQAEVTLVIRVVTTHDDPNDTDLVTSSTGHDDVRRPRRHGGEDWKGFTQIEPKGVLPSPILGRWWLNRLCEPSRAIAGLRGSERFASLCERQIRIRSRIIRLGISSVFRGTILIVVKR